MYNVFLSSFNSYFKFFRLMREKKLLDGITQGQNFIKMTLQLMT